MKMNRAYFCKILGQVLVIILGVSLFMGCETTRVSKEDLANTEEIVIATYDPRSHEIEKVFQELLKETFDDGLPIIDVRVEKQVDTFFLIREGKQDSICRTSRIRLVDDRYGTLYLRISGKGETCTGNKCSQCDFSGLGGCLCIVPVTADGYCDHTITKVRDIIKTFRR
ncbi:protein of unknown function [uncultured Woeseiaceae bacterium]|uniref:Lipoprotein n=1 Tax=uncultured Woeseiaceae bacterium TaxID=1983305 RepID=A0A7D9D2K0_9GAMM|nr:protein of unknown function [uncultured Woeseiaceae bacterium]